MPRASKQTPPGVFARHSPSCASKRGARCSCVPRYQASAWSRRDRKPLRRTFATVAEATAWRRKMQVALHAGTVRAPSNVTLAEAAEAWLDAAKAGVIRTRSGEVYKPSALRSYEQALTTKALTAVSVGDSLVQVNEGDGPAPPDDSSSKFLRRPRSQSTARAGLRLAPRQLARPTAPVADERRPAVERSEEHTSELQSRSDLVCRLLL